MRIQHNIMAMNAYRNYNTNTSALSKNLEKLSSGYKINRAGDDAAGLAISEKMRAQITGLNAAQKNVKDGVSLVKTAEGAMQEIQDMLNRMDYLATQSANGTYDNEVDRANLQKEVDALKTEINRIADSANFNGIKLLDGSLDKDNTDATKFVSDIADQVANNEIADVGTGTILHKEGLNEAKTKFSVDFNNAKAVYRDGMESITLELDGTKVMELTKDDFVGKADGEKLTAQDIVNAFVAKYDGTADDTKVMVGGQEFGIEAGPDNSIIFTQKADPTSQDEVVKGAMSVKIGGLAPNAGGGTAPTVTAKVDIENADIGAVDKAAKFDAKLTLDPKNVQTITVGDKVFQINPDPAVKTAAAADFATGTGTADDPYTVTRSADMTDEDIVAGIAAKLTDGVTISGTKFNVTADGTTLKFEAEAVGTVKKDGQDITAEEFEAEIKAAVTTKTPTGGDNKPDTGLTVTTEVGNEAKAAATAKLEVAAAFSNGGTTVDTPTWVANDTVKFAAAGDGEGNNTFALTFKYDGSNWTLDTSAAGHQALNGYTASFDGEKLTLTSDTANTATGSKTADFGAVTVTASNSGVDAATGTPTFTDGNAEIQAKSGTASATIKAADLAAGDKLNIGGVDLEITEEHLTDVTKLATAIKALAPSDYTLEATGNATTGEVTITLTEKTAGSKAENDLKGALGLTKAEKEEDTPDPAAVAAMNQPAVMPAAGGAGAAGDGQGVGTMDYNASTEVITQGAAPGGNRLASTYMEIKEIKDGSVLKVGDKTYTFAVGKNSAFKNAQGTTVVDMSGWDGKEAGFVDAALTKLTKVAEADGNTMFSIGYQGNGKVTFTEQDTNPSDADLTTFEGIQKQFGYAVDGKQVGSALTLQIGDTSDEFNQMKVSVGDMHTTAMGTEGGASIADIDISSQEGASAAVNVIKNAINYVSGVRGDLGAIQNRLEHTQNNLSVMAENIQDAESTIRDTDVAEEMMSYVKNNILVQSAQAMLAQANQVPQGVLQLLG